MKVSTAVSIKPHSSRGGIQEIQNPRQGSVLLAVIISMVVLSLVGISFMKTALNERSMATRSNLNYLLLNLAESGVESAVWSINNENWDSWNTVSGGTYKVHKEVTTSNGIKTKVHVLVKNANSTNFFSKPVIYSEAVGTLSNGDIVKKQLRIGYDDSGPGLGIVAKEEMDLGGTLTVDSFDSRNGPPDPTSNRSDKVVVSSVNTTQKALVINGDVSVYGYAGTGKEAPVLLGNSLEVKGENSPSGVSVDSDHLFQDFHFEFEEVSEPDWAGAAASLPAAVNGVITIGNTNGIPVSYAVDDVELTDSNLKVVGPVQLHSKNGLNIKSGQMVEIDNFGSLEFYTPGNVNLAGQAVANVSGKPKNLKIFGTHSDPNGQTIDINGQGEMAAVIYAPNADSSVKGTASFLGSMVVNKIKFTGTMDFHFDSSLLEENQKDEITEWHELRKQEHQYDFVSFKEPTI